MHISGHVTKILLGHLSGRPFPAASAEWRLNRSLRGRLVGADGNPVDFVSDSRTSFVGMLGIFFIGMIEALFVPLVFFSLFQVLLIVYFYFYLRRLTLPATVRSAKILTFAVSALYIPP